MAQPKDNSGWTVTEAAELYDVAGWGKGYFSVGPNGHLRVCPTKDPNRVIDLKQLVDRLISRGIHPPLLIRFDDILRHRLSELGAAFRQAIQEHDYQAGYHCVYPIKANHRPQVLEEVLRWGRPFCFGLEAGSKPELLATLAMASNDVPIVCNGFKDARVIETALLAQAVDRKIFLVVEKHAELDLILRHSDRLGVRPAIGVRLKLFSPGAGRWQSSAGYRSKFGLTVTEVLRVLGKLKARGMQDCLKLLHFHLGSQITDIRHIKRALNEAARIYVDLVREGAGLEYLDVGGGLGVDYDGSQSNSESSANYTLQEYANDVVFHVQSVCDDVHVPHPVIFSESGRAVVAYHSLLVFDVLGVSDRGENDVPLAVPQEAEQPLKDLLDTYHELTAANLQESYHDAQQALDVTMSLFDAGYLPLSQRSQAERLFWAICHHIRQLVDQLDYVPEELTGLDTLLSDTYFCNFSLFQSMPDVWAVKQLFPIMPIHRLDERPTRRGVLGDITCDSDGTISHFIDRPNVGRSLPLHECNGRPYYLGAFLIGAYQEVLGDLHNLFGNTNIAHVSVGDDGEASIDAVIKGDTVGQVLDYAQFDARELVNRLRSDLDEIVRTGQIEDHQAQRLLACYQAGMDEYTYLKPLRNPAE